MRVVEDPTYIATSDPADAWTDQQLARAVELKETMLELYQGAMKGRTTYVVPFSMGLMGRRS